MEEGRVDRKLEGWQETEGCKQLIHEWCFSRNCPTLLSTDPGRVTLKSKMSTMELPYLCNIMLQAVLAYVSKHKKHPDTPSVVSHILLRLSTLLHDNALVIQQLHQEVRIASSPLSLVMSWFSICWCHYQKQFRQWQNIKSSWPISSTFKLYQGWHYQGTQNSSNNNDISDLILILCKKSFSRISKGTFWFR